MAIKSHVLCLPLHAQGHINPILQLCTRLASRGIKITVLTSASTDVSMQMKFNLINIESLPDSTDETPTPDDASWEKLKARYLKHLPMIIQDKAASGEPVKLVLFDSTMPFGMDVAEEMGIPGAIFFTQSCAICAICCHVYKGILKVPLEETNSNVSLPSLPPIEKSDLPSFIYRIESWPFLLRLLQHQNSVFHKADWIFINSFDNLEPETCSWLASQYSSIRTIGPTIPSVYLDQQVKEDKDYALNLFKHPLEDCMKWLDSKPTGSVVYASLGSLACPGEEQMVEIAWGLANSNFHFLWVVRESERSKLPINFKFEAQENGLRIQESEQSKLPSNFESEPYETPDEKGLTITSCLSLEVQGLEQNKMTSIFKFEAQEKGVASPQLEVQEPKQRKLPSNFQSEAHERGLIVSWCPQLEVLAHCAVGCFVTHSGWNSTLEALSLGVPMVSIPQWGDQPTNAKFVADVWQAGVRAKANDKGIVTKEEIEIRIKEVMVGEKANMIKKNVLRWKELAKEAMSEGGSSERNIEEFVSSLAST